MYIARILYPVQVLGPGKRVGIWFAGCSKRCHGCSNPELWEFKEQYKTTPEFIYKLVNDIGKEYPIEGFTITGGDPMYQKESLRELIPLLSIFSNDILVYTGYKIGEIDAKYLQGISVLIDGEYIESRNTNCLLRGSDNQKIHIFNKQLTQKYKRYLSKAENRIQNFISFDGIVSVGIHRPDFKRKLNHLLVRKGLSYDERVDTTI